MLDMGGATTSGDLQDYGRRTEYIVFARTTPTRPLAGNRDPNLIGIPRVDTRQLLHPAQKPHALIAYLVMRTSNYGETVLDPFMGCGTTLVAAKSLGRKAIGVEIEERYCEIAAKRLGQEVLPFAEEATA